MTHKTYGYPLKRMDIHTWILCWIARSGPTASRGSESADTRYVTTHPGARGSRHEC